VDIKSEEEKRQEIEAQMAALTAPGTPLSELKGVGPKMIERIEVHGISSIEKLADMTPEQLMEIQGIGEKMVEKIQLSVAEYFQSLEAQQSAAAEGEVAVETVEGEEAPSASEPEAAPEAQEELSQAAAASIQEAPKVEAPAEPSASPENPDATSETKREE
jgi:N utilization substance protein A